MDGFYHTITLARLRYMKIIRNHLALATSDNIDNVSVFFGASESTVQIEIVLCDRNSLMTMSQHDLTSFLRFFRLFYDKMVVANVGSFWMYKKKQSNMHALRF